MCTLYHNVFPAAEMGPLLSRLSVLVVVLACTPVVQTMGAFDLYDYAIVFIIIISS